MIRRTLFFWFDRLKITPAERKAVAGSFLLLMLLSILNMVVTPPAPYGAGYYEALERDFARRTERMRQREAELMARYFPQEVNPESTADYVPIIPADTMEHGTAGDSTAAVQERHRIDINTADSETLQELPGIGPVYAARIIARRRTSGPFQSVEELLEIRGIGKKRLEKIKPFIQLND